MDKLDDGFLKFMIGMKMAQIVHFALEDSPEAFHGPIVDTSTNTRHALNHARFIQLMSEPSIGILKTAVAVKQRFGTGILFNGKIKGIENQFVVVTRTYGERYNAIVLKIKDCTEIEFLTTPVLHFGHISQPFLIELFRCEVAIEYVFGCDFRSGSLILGSLSSDDRLQAHQAGKPVNTAVTALDSILCFQFVSEPPVPVGGIMKGV